MPKHGQYRALYVTDDDTTMAKAYAALVWDTTPDLDRVPTTSIEVADNRREAESVTDTSDVDVSYTGSRKVQATVSVEAMTEGDTDVGKRILLDAYHNNTEIGVCIIRGKKTVADSNADDQFGYWFNARVVQDPSSANNDSVISGDFILVPSNSTYFEDVKPSLT